MTRLGDRGIRYREDVGWEMRCDDCARNGHGPSYWPLDPPGEFWSTTTQMRCKGCERYRLRMRDQRMDAANPSPNRARDRRRKAAASSKRGYYRNREAVLADRRAKYAADRDRILAVRKARYWAKKAAA